MKHHLLALMIAAALPSACGGTTTDSDPGPNGASGGSSVDRTRTACERITDAACGRYADCHAGSNGVQFTAALCSQAGAQVAAECVAKFGPSIAKTADATIDTCVQGMQEASCTDLCANAPPDIPACDAIDPTTTTNDPVTCGP